MGCSQSNLDTQDDENEKLQVMTELRKTLERYLEETAIGEIQHVCAGE